MLIMQRAVPVNSGAGTSLSIILTPHFSNCADFRQLRIVKARTKYYEILPAHTETLHDATHKIVNGYM